MTFISICYETRKIRSFRRINNLRHPYFAHYLNELITNKKTDKMKAKVFEVTYTKKIGGEGSILVKAQNEAQAIKNAAHLCFTGSDFRNVKEVDPCLYVKPRELGYQGSERMN